MDERCIQGLDAIGSSLRRCVLTMGNFDGVHVGHQRILRAARELGDSEHAPVVAMTFEPPPNLLLRPQDSPQRLTPPERKPPELLSAGADWVAVARTDAALLSLPAAQFVETVILARLAPRYVVEGSNFLFGRNRSGDVEVLRSAGRAAGFEVHVVEPVTVDLAEGTRRVSSTLIRSLLLAGGVEDASCCLGRAYVLYGRVVAGEGRGKALGYPTVNLAGSSQVIPGDGVYAGRARVGGREFAAAVSIGTRPTFGAGSHSVEAFLLDGEGTYYGQEVALELLRRLRDQARFDTADALRAQIDQDVRRVREIRGQAGYAGPER